MSAYQMNEGNHIKDMPINREARLHVRLSKNPAIHGKPPRRFKIDASTKTTAISIPIKAKKKDEFHQARTHQAKGCVTQFIPTNNKQRSKVRPGSPRKADQMRSATDSIASVNTKHTKYRITRRQLLWSLPHAAAAKNPPSADGLRKNKEPTHRRPAIAWSTRTLPN